MSQSSEAIKVDRVRSLQGSRLNHPQLEFQDSNLSPGLVLLPANPLAGANVTEYSFFQTSDMEFQPLRGCPDLSVASERTGTPPAGGATHESDEASLSQHLLAQETMVPESGSSGCCSPSQLTSTSEDGTTEEKRGKVNAAKGRRLATPAPSPRPGIDASGVIRQRPPGKAAEVSNVTSGSRSTRPDATSELLYRELMSQSDPRSTPLEPQLVTSYCPDSSDSGTSVTRSDRDCGPVSTNMEPSLWGSGNPTGMEESYRGFMPQSQSTPGSVKVPPKSSVKPKSRRLSAIWSNDGSSCQPTSPPPTATEHQDQTTASRVQSLPTLNYMQKVDAWRESQSSSKTPPFDTMALQGSAGVESGILSDRAKGPAATESCSAAPSRGVSMVGNKAAASSSLMTRQHHSSPPIDTGRLSNTAPLDSHLLAGAQGSKSSQVKLGASLGAACWTSKPKHAGMNTQDQITASSYNLGIDQSASAVPTPFSHRGPIGEPEFSPADLSTVEDSVAGTPTKRVRPEAGSSPKGESCDTLQPAATPRPSQNRNSDASSAARSQEDPSTSESSGVRARSSPFGVTFPLSSEKRVGVGVTPRRSLCQPNGRAEPEGCSAAPPDNSAFPSPPTMDPQEPASLSENPTDTPDGEHSLAGGSEMTDFSAPIPENRDPAVMSDVSSKSSLTARVAKLLQGESTSDQKDPEHRKKFLRNLSGGQFESLDLDKEDRERIEELKAEMLSNHFLTSESSTDTESTAASGVAAVAAQHLSDVKGAWTPVLPGPKRAELEARLQEIAAGGGVSLPRTNVQSHTSITISTRKREASPPPAPVHLAELPAGSATLSEEGSEMFESEDPPCSSKAQDGEEETTCEESRHVTEDTTIPFSPQTSTQPGYISQVHLTISPKSSQPAPRASSSSSHTSAESAHDNFAPLRRSSPAVSSADEGVGPPGPPDTSAPPKDPSEPPREETTAAGPHQSFTASHSNMTGRSFTPEMPVRDDCAPRAAPLVLQPYKPCGATELFLIPQGEANSSTSCTTMESSHTGSDDAIPPLFSSEVLGHQDPGLDRGVTIKHAQGIYSKKPHRSTVRTREAAHRDKTPPQVSPVPREASRMEPIEAGGKRDVDLHPQSNQSWPVTTEREAWLMEQLLRLSDLIHNTRGASGQPARTYYGREEPRVGGGKAADGRTPPPPRQAWTHHPEELGHAPFASTSRFCPADRDESTTSKSTSTSTSTVDTDRLIRVFGPHRVQPAKSQSGLQKLYSSISRQRDEWEGRSLNSQTETTSEESNVTAESSSTGSPVRTSKNNGKVVSRGVQAGDLEIVCNATRHHTRDVGTIFPSPRHPQRSQPASHKQKKSRAPPKPKAVSWFIPLDHVESQSRKENRPEEQEEEEEEEEDILEPSSLWYDTYRRSVVWRQPLQPRQHHLTTQVTSLQEALVMYRPDFICRSRQRLHILTQHNQDRKAIGRPAGVLMRAVPWKEMIQRTKRMYDSLPEVQRKRAAERQKAQTQSNRLNVQLYNKKLTKRLLENRPAASHQNYW